MHINPLQGAVRSSATRLPLAGWQPAVNAV